MRNPAMQLNSHDDFTPLREIIVGSAENYLSHDRDVTFELFHHDSLRGFRSDWAYPRLAAGGDRSTRSWAIKRRYTAELHEDVENLAATLSALAGPSGLVRS
jgi:glycine amidinotransferase